MESETIVTLSSFLVEPNPRPATEAERAQKMVSPAFGTVFTDHIAMIPWHADRGWHDPRITARASLSLDPAASVLHYGQAVFEGFKAYRQPDGSVATFRPNAHGERFIRSCERMAMPGLPVETFIEATDRLILQDRAWVPTHPEHTMYLRPLMIATEAALGVRRAQEYLFLVQASPTGPYFASGIRPIAVWASREYSRTAPGGTGMAKCAGNYAASLLPQEQARSKGCSQVMWLDAKEHRFVEELGGMNLFFVLAHGSDKVVVTPTIEGGTLLAGITRASLLELARARGYRVEERLVPFDEVLSAIADGTMLEIFACGTAAVVTPVGRVLSNEGEHVVTEDEQMGPVSAELRSALVSIQRGTAPDTHGWMHTVPGTG